jgi:hypothetical protein
MPKESKVTKITPTIVLPQLWKDGTFKTWQKSADITDKLASKGYHFTSAELSMALSRASYLTRRGKAGAYEYIQKGPYSSENEK